MIRYILLTFTLISFAFTQAFEVQNVTASQRTDGSHIVDVCYDLTPDDLFVSFRITAELSTDGGETWSGLNIPTEPNVMGDNVFSGENKCFEISLGDYLSNTYSSTTQVRVMAEGHEALELPFEMVEVDAGEFMGEKWVDYNWGGFHEDTLLTIDYDFEIMKYEVTNAEYLQFMLEGIANGYLNQDCNNTGGSQNLGFNYPGETFMGFFTDQPHHFPANPNSYGGCDDLIYYGEEADNDWRSQIYWNGTTFVISEGYGDHPVNTVSYIGAWAFANYYGLRLPTKDEWLKAARGINTWETAYGPEYGYDNPPNRANLNISGDPFDNHGQYRRTTPVGFYNGEPNQWDYETIDSPSPYGTYDQTGNVFEWTTTCSEGHSNGPKFFVKGGAWNNGVHDTALNNDTATWAGSQVTNGFGGFRCIRTIPDFSNQETPSNSKTIK